MMLCLCFHIEAWCNIAWMQTNWKHNHSAATLLYFTPEFINYCQTWTLHSRVQHLSGVSVYISICDIVLSHVCMYAHVRAATNIRWIAHLHPQLGGHCLGKPYAWIFWRTLNAKFILVSSEVSLVHTILANGRIKWILIWLHVSN